VLHLVCVFLLVFSRSVVSFVLGLCVSYLLLGFSLGSPLRFSVCIPALFCSLSLSLNFWGSLCVVSHSVLYSSVIS